MKPAKDAPDCAALWQAVQDSATIVAQDLAAVDAAQEALALAQGQLAIAQRGYRNALLAYEDACGG